MAECHICHLVLSGPIIFPFGCWHPLHLECWQRYLANTQMLPLALQPPECYVCPACNRRSTRLEQLELEQGQLTQAGSVSASINKLLRELDQMLASGSSINQKEWYSNRVVYGPVHPPLPWSTDNFVRMVMVNHQFLTQSLSNNDTNLQQFLIQTELLYGVIGLLAFEVPITWIKPMEEFVRDLMIMGNFVAPSNLEYLDTLFRSNIRERNSTPSRLMSGAVQFALRQDVHLTDTQATALRDVIACTTVPLEVRNRALTCLFQHLGNPQQLIEYGPIPTRMDLDGLELRNVALTQDMVQRLNPHRLTLVDCDLSGLDLFRAWRCGTDDDLCPLRVRDARDASHHIRVSDARDEKHHMRATPPLTLTLTRCNLNNATFQGLDLTRSTLDHCPMHNANLSNCCLATTTSGVSLLGCDLRGCNLEGVQVESTHLQVGRALPLYTPYAVPLVYDVLRSSNIFVALGPSRGPKAINYITGKVYLLDVPGRVLDLAVNGEFVAFGVFREGHCMIAIFHGLDLVQTVDLGPSSNEYIRLAKNPELDGGFVFIVGDGHLYTISADGRVQGPLHPHQGGFFRLTPNGKYAGFRDGAWLELATHQVVHTPDPMTDNQFEPYVLGPNNELMLEPDIVVLHLPFRPSHRAGDFVLAYDGEHLSVLRLPNGWEGMRDARIQPTILDRPPQMDANPQGVGFALLQLS